MHAVNVEREAISDRVRTLRRQARDYRAIAQAYRVQKCTDSAARFDARADAKDADAAALERRYA